jgi:CTP synthase
MTRYIFITGGVTSSLGKGLAASALAALLQSRGYKVRLRKLDPYLNVDPGTMSPVQHGEVFVTEDGAETDLDLGHYERFTDVDAKKTDNITAGQIYSKLLYKERKGDYLGKTVQVIPHITDLIKKFIKNDSKDIDFMLCEIGGTVGDIEGLPFFEAIRQIHYEIGSKYCAFLHLTLLPYIESANELKTKPTQHSVKELRSIGIQPNILLCRADKPISEDHLNKISLMTSVPRSCVIAAPNAKSIYEVPIIYHHNKLDSEILKFFDLKYESKININHWYKINDAIENPTEDVNIAIVGKYTGYIDSYKSLIEALIHAGIYLKLKVNIIWINARKNQQNLPTNINAVIVPGGFGIDGSEGKINTIKIARTNKIPFLGICYGMQMTVIEYARNVLDISDATSTEISSEGTKLIAKISEWQVNNDIKFIKEDSDIGGTMRLGSYPCNILKNSLAYEIYKSTKVNERHRHRYEVNIKYKKQLEDGGLIFSGMSSNNNLTEIVEIDKHPFFLATQFHPELKSRPFCAHPIFINLLNAAKKYKKNN